MLIVNPSVNISIGDYGEKYLSSFYDYFRMHEAELSHFASFYKLIYSNEKVSYKNIRNNAENSSELVPAEKRSDIHKQLSEAGKLHFFKNAFNESYIELVNLRNQLGVEINFKIINVNIILSGFEEYNTVLLDALVKSIKELEDSGITANITVKVFVVLTKDEALLNPQEEVITYRTFEEIKSIQKNNNTVFHNIVFIDNKNTDTVFLGINEDSIGFVLNEFITYLMTNHYKMIGNLFNASYLSLGLGMLYFDFDYFKTYFRHKIINQKLEEEHITGNPVINIAPYVALRNKFLKPFLVKRSEFDVLLAEIESRLHLNRNQFSLIEYKYFLSQLLGKHDEVPTEGNKFLNTEKISLIDVACTLLCKFNTFLSGDPDINIFEHKKLLDNIPELKDKLAEFEKENKEGVLDEKITELKQQLSELEELTYNQKEQIDSTLSDYRNSGLNEKTDKALQEINRQISILNEEKSVIIEKRKSIFNRLFKPGLKKQLQTIIKQAEELNNKKRDVNKNYKNVDSSLTSLFLLIEELDKRYSFLIKAIEKLSDINKEFRDQDGNSALLDYLFIKNVIDRKILNSYFSNNKKELLHNLSGILNEISTLYNKNNAIEKFYEFVISKTDQSISEIINFNIINYLNGEYDDLNIFKREKLEKVIDDLLDISKPFIIPDAGHKKNDSHEMILHNTVEQRDVDNLYTHLRRSFTATIPQQINTLNNHKFTLIKVDVIKDFEHIAKYNICKKTYDREGDNSIII